YSVCCLCDDASRPVATFVQQQLHHFPLPDGPSTAQRSVRNPELVALTTELLARACWRGVAEAEFIVDRRDGTPWLIEVNPRFWGSVHLAISCGVPFPSLLFRLG